MKDLEELLEDQLPHVDDLLNSWGEALSRRPHQAAQLITKHCIQEVKVNDEVQPTDKGFLTSVWFGYLLSLVIDWYDKQYGEALSANSDLHQAVVLVRNIPTRLPIQLTLSSKPENDSFWITFAASVQPDETPTDWLIKSPPLSSLSDQQREDVDIQTTWTVNKVRGISNGLLSTKREHLEQAGLILSHLDKAAEHILTARSSSLSSGIWEANFATENAIKCHLHKLGKPAPKGSKGHDILHLSRVSGETNRPEEIEIAIASMPSGSEAIKYRYIEAGHVSVQKAMEVYKASLAICHYYTNLIQPSKLKIQNMKLQLGLPPMPQK